MSNTIPESNRKKKRAYAKRAKYAFDNREKLVNLLGGGYSSEDEERLTDDLAKVRKSYFRARRSRVITPEIEFLLMQAFTSGCSDKQALSYACSYGFIIAERTFYNFLEKNPDFKEKRDAAKLNPENIARVSLIKGLPQDPKLAFDFLKSKLPKEFKGEDQPGTIVNVGSTINSADLEKFADTLYQKSIQREKEAKERQENQPIPIPTNPAN